MNDAPTPNKDAFYFHWELGHMKNIVDRWALGGAVFLGADDLGSRLALKGRVRRWIGPRTSVDLSPGILVLISDRYKTKAPGFTGHVGLNFREWFQLVAMVEVIDMEPDRRRYPDVEPGLDTAWYAGAKMGGRASLVGTVILFAVAISQLNDAPIR